MILYILPLKLRLLFPGINKFSFVHRKQSKSIGRTDALFIVTGKYKATDILDENSEIL